MRRWVTSAVALLGAWAASCSTRDVELGSRSDPTVITVAGAPADIGALFDADPADDEEAKERDLALLYPNHEALLPRNLASPEVLWHAEGRLDRFELNVAGDEGALRVRTGERAFSFDRERWERLSADNAGRELRLWVRAAAADEPGRVVRSPELRVRIARSEVPGAVYFWSTGAQGIMRGSVGSRVATKFFPPPGDADGDADAGAKTPVCVGCHTLSRDGRRLAMGYGGELLREVTVPERTRVLPAGDAEAAGYGWGSFDPAATRLLVANRGRLSLLDADTGNLLTEVDVGTDRGATHPDWSPDGRHVAVTLLDEKWEDNEKVERSSIARIPVRVDGSFGEPEVLVESVDDATLSFPAYSPDGRYLAYGRTEGKSKDSKKSKIWIVAADGSADPVELGRLNAREGLKDGKDLGNAMPTWAPGVEPESYWLAFSSSRDYGETRTDDKRDLLWAAAVDPEVGPGEDPSAAAFWLPFQQPEDSNHRAFWAQASACSVTAELCDGGDDDCDGVVDEDCCSPEPERCGDGIDNDCDGERDEACGCAFAELCAGDDVDEDCDGRLDEDCLM